MRSNNKRKHAKSLLRVFPKRRVERRARANIALPRPAGIHHDARALALNVNRAQCDNMAGVDQHRLELETTRPTNKPMIPTHVLMEALQNVQQTSKELNENGQRT